MLNAVLTVYDEYDLEQKDRKDYVVVRRPTDVFSVFYRLCPSLDELTAIPRSGDFKQLSTVTDELDKCSWDEGTMTLENWL